MPVTRIKNNQITDLTVNAASKLQDFSITSTKIANNLTYGSDFTIAGNLTVQGNVTAIDTVDLVVEDPLILLAKDQTGTPALDIGFIGRRGDELNIAFVWDESADRFVTAFTTSEVTNTVITINSYASLQVLDLDAANLTITGNTVLGNLSLSGNVLVDMGNSIIGNVAEPVANSDVATKAYVDSVSSSGFTIEDDVANTTVVSGGDTLMLLGTADEITVLITDPDEITFGLPANVTIADNLTVTNAANVGSLVSLGNISGNNLSGNAGAFTGNVSGDTFLGNISGATGVFTGNVSGDTFLGNILGNAGAFTGNVSGDTFLGNIDGVTGVFSGDVSAANVDVTTAVNANQIVGTDVTIISTGTLDLQPSGNITVSGALIRDVGDPLTAQDAATKQYVDDAVSSGIHIHAPVQVETPVALPAATYAQGGNTFTVNETVAGNTVVFTTAANLQVNDQLWFDNSFNGVVGNLAYFVVSTPNTSAAVLSTTYSGEPVSNITSGSGLTESVRVNSGIGATLTANVNGALSVDGVSVTNGDRVLVYQQALGFENGVYDVTDAGNVSAPWILTRSSDTDTYEPQTSTGLDQGSYFYVQGGDTGAGESYVKTQPPGPFIIGLANIEFTQFSASQVYSANTQAGLSLTGTVFSAKVDLDTTAFDNGGNISVKASANLVTPNIGDATGNSLTLTGNGLISATTVSATGNVSGGNITTAGMVSATGNVLGGNISTTGSVSGATGTFTGNVTVDTVLGNISGATGTFTGNVSGDTFLGNISGTTGVFTGNVSGDQFVGNFSAAGSNTEIQFNDGGLLGGDADFTFDKSTGQVVISGSLVTDNVVVDGDSITSLGTELVINDAGADINFRVEGDAEPNLFIVDAGSDTVLIGTASSTTGAALKIGTTDSIMVPVGNTAQRPGTPATGMFRFNTTNDVLEYYDSNSWESISLDFTIVVSDVFAGDGSTTQFTLSEDSTTAATIVSINGVVQEPTVAYAIAGNVLTFTEAPESSDTIDARILTTTTSITGISNDSGNAVVTASASAAQIEITGDLIPTANVTYDLGSPTAYWQNAYFAGNTIFLGPLQLKAVSSTEFGVFTSDGTTTADLDVGNIDVAALNQGNTSIGIAGLSGNAYVTVDGTANVLVVSAVGADITGALGVTGNVTAGNVSGTNLTGTITTASQPNITEVGTLGSLDVTGNVTAGNVSGTNIVGTLTTAAQPNITSVGTLTALTVTGNVAAGNLSGTNITGTLTTAAQPNITSVGTLGNLLVTGNVSANNFSATTLIRAGNVAGWLDDTDTDGDSAAVISVANQNNGTEVISVNRSSGTLAYTEFLAINDAGNVETGWCGIGINSSTYVDPLYPITKADDGFILYEAPLGSTNSGNLVIGTGSNGNVNAIIFGAGGFASGNTQMEILPDDRVQIDINTESTSTGTGALVVKGGIGLTGNLNVGGSVNIVGNITLGGSGNTIDVSSLVVDDPLIYMGANNAADLLDLGFVGEYNDGTVKYTGLVRDASDAVFKFFSNVSPRPTESIDFASGNLVYPGLLAGNLSLNSGVNSTSTTSGALTVSGGIGVTGAIHAGGLAQITGNVIAGNVNSDGVVVVIGTNDATSTTTGSIRTAGGIGAAGNVYVGGLLSVTGNVSAGNLALTTALPVSSGGTGITAFGTGVATALGQNVTGSGGIALATSPSFTTPVLGTPTSGNLSNCTADGTNAVGFRNIPLVADKTTSYTLQTADVGKVVSVGSGGSITIPNSTFSAGDAVLVFNNTSGDITITCTITTAYIAGANSDVASITLVTRGIASILFVSGTVCVITGNVS